MQNSWSLECNAGYYLRPGTGSTGTCYGRKNCCYDPAQNYYGSCTHVCNYVDYYGYSSPCYCALTRRRGGGARR